MEFFPNLVLRVFLKTVFPNTFFTLKIIEDAFGELKIIFVEFEKGFGTTDSLSIDLSCEKPIIERNKNKIKSIFFIIYFCLKT